MDLIPVLANLPNPDNALPLPSVFKFDVKFLNNPVIPFPLPENRLVIPLPIKVYY